ncbi:glycosyltransferase [Enterococcus hermanniensis]|uniref:Glycosyltransferase 2-like domain-containing protein n=1 Tax=Enterococcus hermanniensis TaxID=249189 RepID=A0A1L8TFI2_9ENTE|nr:glycosyltransferase [Enterococcus hermanniensis]OJG42973.1 hypothetical protein RV04_GL000732 [Enterococcus hermanniensis]
MNSTVIVIPSLEPDKKLLDLLTNLKEQISTEILIINDGSPLHFQHIFENAKNQFSCTVLEHSENYGKGAALKTAMRYILANMPHIKHMVTVDSDGQHRFSDINKCIHRAQEENTGLILGTRTFEGKVPFRSLFGNVLTRKILKLSTGINITDTQTGLRVIPRQYMKELLSVEGERFEYELRMLIETKKHCWPIICEPIKTIYINDNETSHFRAISDSISIYSVFIKYLFDSERFQFFRYLISALLSFTVDILAYGLLITLATNFTLSTVVIVAISARIMSSTINYLLNKSIVFKKESDFSLFKYFGLVFAQISVSSILVYLLSATSFENYSVMIKVIVDSCLFLLSYQIQKKFIFRKEKYGYSAKKN